MRVSTFGVVTSKRRSQTQACGVAVHSRLAGPGGWTLQLFRSINKHSAAGVADQEDGCQAAYVLAIRRAKRFVYLESQWAAPPWPREHQTQRKPWERQLVVGPPPRPAEAQSGVSGDFG